MFFWALLSYIYYFDSMSSINHSELPIPLLLMTAELAVTAALGALFLVSCAPSPSEGALGF